MKRTKRALALLCLALALTLLMGTAYAASPLLRRGSRGADVKQLQGNLIYLGYLNDVADGIFGAKTEAAVPVCLWGNKCARLPTHENTGGRRYACFFRSLDGLFMGTVRKEARCVTSNSRVPPAADGAKKS